MFKLTLCFSVTVEDLNLQQYIYEDINILDTGYFILLDSILSAQ